MSQIQRKQKYVHGKLQNWPKEVSIYTDGASRGNPGRASFGLRVADAQDQTLFAEAQFIGEWSNSVAEYEGICRAFELAVQNKVETLCLKTDSQFISRQLPSNKGEFIQWKELQKDPLKFIQKEPLLKKHLKKSLIPQPIGKYKITTPQMVPFFKRCVELMEQFEGSFKIVHVKREENSRADALANMALDLE